MRRIQWGKTVDNIMGLFTSTEGRIGRGRWWLGVVILIVAAIIVSLILSLVGLGVWPNVGTLDPNNPQAFVDSAAAASRTAAWGSLLSFIILAYPSYALSVKRRHDRDNAGVDLLVYYGLSVVMLLLQALGIGMGTTDLGNGIIIPTPSTPIMLLQVVMGIYDIYLLVVLGFLRGTPGTNQYGLDPLGGATATARA